MRLPVLYLPCGFFFALQTLRGKVDERISHELKEWRTNFISVQSYMDDLVVSRGKLRSVEEEVGVSYYCL